MLLETFGSLGIASLVIDRDGKIVEANKAAEDAFGYSGQDLPGIGITTLILDMDVTNFTRPTNFICECIRSSGAIFSSNVSIVPLEHESPLGKGVSIVAVRDFSGPSLITKKASFVDKEISIFNYLNKSLAKPLNMKRILRETVGRLPSLMECDAAWVHLVDEKGSLELTVHEGCTEACIEDIKRLDPGGACLIGKVFGTGRPLVVKDASSDPRVTHIRLADSGLRSMASVPMQSSGKVLGVLSLASSGKSFFDPFEMKILSAVGNQLGVAIENARLITQLRKRMEQIELINEVSSAITSSLSIGTLFRIMVTEIRKLVGFDRASLLLYNEKEDHLLILALETQMKTVLPKGVKAPVEGTSSGWAAKNNEPYINYDLRREIPFAIDRKLYDEGIRSTVSIPLYQDRVLGVFNLDSIEPMRYSPDDLQLLVPISKHISIALENTFLFEEVSREKMEWEKTFDAITDMVWIEDRDRLVLRANKALLDNAGLSVSGLRGMHCSNLLARVGIVSVDCLCEDLPVQESQSFREIRETSGSVYNFWIYPLKNEKGKVYASVHYLKDVTNQKRIEQQLIRNDKLASLGILVSGIAHEINNPLGIIAGYSEALLDRAEDEDLKAVKGFEDFPEYLETIHKEIFRCKEILGSLLGFASPQSGKTRILDINELIMEVMLLVKHKAKSLKHNLDLDLNRDLPKVNADPGSLRQLFMNIIINAMYYTPEGGKIQILTGIDNVIQNTASGEKQMLKISISDTGSGIAEDIIERIFDPFYTTKPTGAGAGLGLSICQRIAREHGGMIEVESGQGVGTTFSIRLPVAEEQ